MAKKSEIEKLMVDQGFNIGFDNDGDIYLEPGFIRLDSIKVLLIKRGKYIADPALVPPELQDKNIIWIEEPPIVTATTQNGNEINIYVNQIVTEFKEIHPNDGR